MVEVGEEETCHNAPDQRTDDQGKAIEEEEPVGPVDCCIELESQSNGWVQTSFSEGESGLWYWLRSSGEKIDGKKQILVVFSTHVAGFHCDQDEENENKSSKGLANCIDNQGAKGDTFVIEYWYDSKEQIC